MDRCDCMHFEQMITSGLQVVDSNIDLIVKGECYSNSDINFMPITLRRAERLSRLYVYLPVCHVKHAPAINTIGYK